MKFLIDIGTVNLTGHTVLTNNNMKGEVPVNGSFSLFTPIRLVQIIKFLSMVIVEGRPENFANPLFHFTVIKTILA